MKLPSLFQAGAGRLLAVTMDLKAGANSKDGTFDRFGIFCGGAGGDQVKHCFDDLQYTAAGSW